MKRMPELLRRSALKLSVIVLLLSFICCDEEDPEVLLLTPANGSTEGFTVTFSWQIINADEKACSAVIYLDKGEGPFDGWYETSYSVEPGVTGLTVDLPAATFRGATISWGVRIWDGDKHYKSDIWKFNVAN